MKSISHIPQENIRYVIALRGARGKYDYDFVSKLSHTFKGEDEVLSFSDLEDAIHFEDEETAISTLNSQPLWAQRRCKVIPFEKCSYGECFMIQ